MQYTLQAYVEQKENKSSCWLFFKYRQQEANGQFI